MPALLCLNLGNPGCKEESPSEPGVSTLPALTDPIPIDRLGEGKLVFERVPFGEVNGIIYVVDVAQQRSWGIDPANRGGGVTGPIVSPAGTRIVYAALTSIQTAYDIYIVDVNGANRQRVTDLPSHESYPSWVDDGTQILFYGSGVYLYRQSPVPHPTDRVVLIDFGTFDLQDLSAPGEPVSASSNGNLLVPKRGAYVTDADGSNPVHVILPFLNERLFSPAWSPDGLNIAAGVVRGGGTADVSIAIVKYEADGTGPDTLVTLRGDGGAYPSLCWSPDGSQIAFTNSDSTDLGGHIYLIRRDRTGLTQVTFGTGVTDRSLSWSR